MFNMANYNAEMFNGSGWTTPDTETYSPDQPYILHLVTSAGALISKIEGFTDGSWDSKINKPSTLKFSIPLDSDLAQGANLKAPNEIYLYDSSAILLKKFSIVKTIAKISASESILDVECADYMYLLSKEYAPLYTTANSTSTLGDQVNNLLSNQVGGTTVTLGYIAPEYANQDLTTAQASDRTIIKAMMHIWKQVGGVITIDPQGRLRWDTDNPKSAKYTMSLYDDISEYEMIEDSERIVNRIYSKRNNIYFDGSTHDRLSAAGYGYIEDTASQAIYGIRPKQMNFNAADPSELASLMARTLETMKDPKITRKISAIDLRKAQFDPDNPVTPHPSYIFVGAKLNINPPSNVPNDSYFKGMITSVKRDLRDFLNVSITVADENAISARLAGSNGGGDAESEFFDILADGVQDEYNSDPSDWDEVLFDQDEEIWDFLDNIQEVENPSTDDNDIQPVGAANDAGGTATGVAFVDHVHQGIIMVEFDDTHTGVSDLGVPDGMAFGYLSDLAGTDEGLWFFPPDGTVNADWIPMPNYN